jgi:hypothetical protein
MYALEIVALVFAIIAFASIIRSRHPRRFGRWRDDNAESDAESQRLHAEVQVLKDRVAVLERIITDKSSTLEREIEQLRDR